MPREDGPTINHVSLEPSQPICPERSLFSDKGGREGGGGGEKEEGRGTIDRSPTRKSMDKQSYLIRPRDRTLNFCSLSSCLDEFLPSFRFEVRSKLCRGGRSSLFFFPTCLGQDDCCCDGDRRFITMSTDKYWLKGNIGSKQVFQVVVMEKRGGGGCSRAPFFRYGKNPVGSKFFP